MRLLTILALAITLAFSDVLPDSEEANRIEVKITEIKEAPKPPLPSFANPFGATKKPVFVATQKRVATKEPELVLEGVVANKALISGKWYKKDEKIGDWVLEAIFLDFVVLQKDAVQKRVAMQENRYKNDNITKASR